MDVMSLLVQLLSGAVGGNIAGAAMKKFSLGTIGNSIVGILGGGLGGQIFGMLGMGGRARFKAPLRCRSSGHCRAA